MKKKLYSLLLCICLFFGGILSFSGCSIYTKDNEKTNAEVVMKIGETEVTKNDLYSAFYTYYQNNSTYFAYYSQDLIEESFYTWFTVKTLVSELSYKALDDGNIFYTNEDAETVWEYVEDYFYSQVSSYEKLFYESEEDYPEWLQSSSEDEEAAKFECYTKSTEDIEEELKKDRRADATKKLTNEEVYSKVAELKSNLFKYELDGNETKLNMDGKGDEVYKNRERALQEYLQALKLNAKASGNTSSEDELFKAEVLRIYNAYYDSQISVIFQNYYMQEHLLNVDRTSLGNRAIVEKFLDKYYKDQQVNKVYEAYVSTMESEDGASLVLYHYQGRVYYFSVQHILLAFGTELSNKVQNLEGYDSKDFNESKNFIEARKDLAEENKFGILVEIDENRAKNTLLAISDYYYFDEGKKDVYDESSNIFNGYVKLTTHNVVNNEVVYTDVSYTNSSGVEITRQTENVGIKRMANIRDVEESLKLTYKYWFELAEQVYDCGAENFDNKINEICSANDNKLEDLRYVLEVAKNFKQCGLSKDELKSKIGSLLFIELEWLYSGDSLDNKISNKIGYLCPSTEDDNKGLVVEFADGAREILKEMSSTDFGSSVPTGQDLADYKATFTKTYVTNYGYHIIKLENVYDKANASIIDLDSISAQFSLEENSDYVNEVAALLKKTYVCASSNQTLYDYFYDEVYNSLAGTSSSSGTYFLGLEYEWLSKYNKDNKIETFKKLTYDELIASLS